MMDNSRVVDVESQEPQSMTEPARRFVVAQSWWIASEIVRRSPELFLIETHPGGGQYDCLSLMRRTSTETTTLIHLNRVGSIHAHDGSGRSLLITWSEALAAAGGHNVVRRLEVTAGLHPARQAPATSPRVLTYRVIARILTSLVDDRHFWDARSGQLDSSGMDSVASAGPEVTRFPSVQNALRERRLDDPLDPPGCRFWLLLKDSEPVAVLDTSGHLHLPGRPPKELLPMYRESRSLTTTIGSALGGVLT
ncbi:hypothetical protein ACIGG9_26855 [Pseudonocardia alni]|uniref:TY-Chap2 family putative peptide chaperone n=1 Tax=Pseudonocardia alni TaxID=33907 RepID=UPI0037C5EC24